MSYDATYTTLSLSRAQRRGQSMVSAAVAVQEALNGRSVVVASGSQDSSRDARNRVLRELWRRQCAFWDSQGTIELDSEGSIRFMVPEKPSPIPIQLRYLKYMDPAGTEP